MATLELTRVLAPRGPAGALVLTDEEVAVLGGGKRAAVLVRVGDREARLRLGVMGGENLIGMSKATRTDLGLEVGQQVTATITVDEAPREVDVPDDLAVALAGDAAAKDAFEALPFSARKEFAVWVGGAKRADTRARRLEDTLRMLHEGKRLSLGVPRAHERALEVPTCRLFRPVVIGRGRFSAESRMPTTATR